MQVLKGAKMQHTMEDVQMETNTRLHGNAQHGPCLKIAASNRQERGVGADSRKIPPLHTMFSGSLTLHSDTNVKPDGKVQRFYGLKLAATNPHLNVNVPTSLSTIMVNLQCLRTSLMFSVALFITKSSAKDSVEL